MGKQPCINPLIVIIINCCILKYAPKKAMLVSEYATKNRFTIVTVKAFRAFIIKEGSPKIIIFCTNFLRFLVFYKNNVDEKGIPIYTNCVIQYNF